MQISIFVLICYLIYLNYYVQITPNIITWCVVNAELLLDCSFIVDAMSSFGGMPLDISSSNTDFVISSSNKCIQGVPGFGFVIARKSKLLTCQGTILYYYLLHFYSFFTFSFLAQFFFQLIFICCPQLLLIAF